MKRNSYLVAALLASMWTVSVSAAPEGTAVVTKPVESMPVSEPIAVNAVIRSRHDIVLPSTVDGELMWVLEEGTHVQQGEAVAKVDDEALSLQRREQQLLADRAEINVAYLQREVERLSKLNESNMASRTQLAEMTSRRDLAANDLAVARARIAQIDESLSKTEIVSPVDAVVVERIHQGGEFARRGEGVARVVNPGALEVLATIPVTYLNRVVVGQSITVTVGDARFETRLRSKISASDASSQTFNVLADVPAALVSQLAAGQFAEASVPLASNGTSLFVPRDAVVLRADGNYVYRIDENNIARRIVVTLGAGQGDRVAVSGELQAGDKVAVRGVERLVDGQSVSLGNS